MKTLDGPPDPRNPIVALLGEAIAFALRQPGVLDALREATAPTAPAVTPKTTGLTKKELGAALGKSVSSIDRLDREGAPHTFCGDTKRYDLEAYRTWLSARGKRPTKAAPPSNDVDISDVADAAGLRAAR